MGEAPQMDFFDLTGHGSHEFVGHRRQESRVRVNAITCSRCDVNKVHLPLEAHAELSRSARSALFGTLDNIAHRFRRIAYGSGDVDRGELPTSYKNTAIDHRGFDIRWLAKECNGVIRIAHRCQVNVARADCDEIGALAGSQTNRFCRRFLAISPPRWWQARPTVSA